VTLGLGLAAALLAALAVLALVASWRLRAATGLPAARVMAQDTERGERPAAPLVSHRLRLVGRPDYLLAHEGAPIPVEVKPRRRAAAPYPADLLQLAAYCLLVEETHGRAPAYGILRYAGLSWQVPFDAAARQAVLDALGRLEADRRAPEVHRSHDQPARCAACGLAHACTERLA
jgi:CRISPR-associated exonuclease Cas4